MLGFLSGLGSFNQVNVGIRKLEDTDRSADQGGSVHSSASIAGYSSSHILTLIARAWALYTQLGLVIPRYRLSVGTSEKIQLSSLIAAFQVTRDLIVAEA